MANVKKKVLKRTELRKRAKALYRDGLTMEQIAVKFKDAGIVSERTGNPYTFGGISSILRVRRKSTKKTVVKKVTAKSAKIEKVITAVRELPISDSDKWQITDLILSL